MSFGGPPVVKLVSDSLVRITNAELAAGDTGEIRLYTSGAVPEGVVLLPDGFQPGQYADVSLSDAIQVSYVFTGVADAVKIRVEKTEGPPFKIVFTNDDATDATMEIYIRFH